MTNEQIILGIILLALYLAVHIIIIVRMNKANKQASKILEDLLPPKDKEQPYEAYELGKYTDWKDSNRPPES